ncbi:unnamed protein product [Blepharisma stoltei]|uniref:Uncharacterized protein n=1 Tax=Blepharisma stoltei TaxID=1481888 RepID=A0AAU9K3D4_9CILI|nr:unnamed protein product [Blepharisma stoltei]
MESGEVNIPENCPSRKNNYAIYVFEPLGKDFPQSTSSRKIKFDRYQDPERPIKTFLKHKHKGLRSENSSVERGKKIKLKRPDLVISTENIISVHKNSGSYTDTNLTEISNPSLPSKVKLKLIEIEEKKGKPERNSSKTIHHKKQPDSSSSPKINHMKKAKYIRPKVAVELRHFEARAEAKLEDEDNSVLLPPINLNHKVWSSKNIERLYTPSHHKVSSLTPADTPKVWDLSPNPSGTQTKAKSKPSSRSKSSAPSERRKLPARFLALEEIEHKIGISKDRSFKLKSHVKLDLKLIREHDEQNLKEQLEKDKNTRWYIENLKKHSILKSIKEFGETWDWNTPGSSPNHTKSVRFQQELENHI